MITIPPTDVVAARSHAPAGPKPSGGLSYLPGLDGLRAISVVAVLLYHAQLTWLPGGFLGVEVFFVISGYLITLLLTTEHERRGRIDLKQFWLRRARRLLPALYALLVAVCVWTVLFFRTEVGELRAQVLAALTYVTNWYLIASDTSYFDQLGRPPVLRHLWSLAVEEQFYLVWPLVVFALMAVFRRRVLLMAAVIFTAAMGSAIWMAVLYVPGTDPSRVYYGTDTRAAGLLLGAVMALFWRPSALRRGAVRDHGSIVDLAGLIGLVIIAFFFLQMNESDAFLYQGGFVVLSLATLLVIAAATHPTTVLGGRFALGNNVLAWVGTRSYGLYLWHWPVYVYTRPGVDVPWTPGVTLAVRLALTVVLTELSYRLIETPVRKGALGRWFGSLRGPETDEVFRRRRLTVITAAASLAVLLPVAVLVLVTKPEPNEIAASLDEGAQAIGDPSALDQDPATSTPTTTLTGATPVRVTSTSAVDATTTPGSVVVPETTVPTDPVTTAAPATAAPDPNATTVPVDPNATTVPTVPTTLPATVPPPVAGRVTAIGDSVMLGASPGLKAAFGDRIVIDAKVSRQMPEGASVIQALQAQGRFGPALVVHLGTNGVISTGSFDAIMQAAGNVPVWFVNVRLPKPTEARVNNFLAANVARYPNAKLIDWHGFSDGHLDWFYKDGTHLKPPGAQQYAALILQSVG